jgi:hypothetical protein
LTRVMMLATLAGLVALGAACSKKIERFTVDRVVERSLRQDDLGKACAMGEALTHALTALPKASNPPRKALVIAEATAAMCNELDARQAELDVARAKETLSALGDGRMPEIIDAGLEADRHNAMAARRFDRAWVHLEALYGPIGAIDGECPKVKEKDEIVFLIGLLSGTLSVLRDRTSGGSLDLPLDRINAVGRAAGCLDDARWWNTPSAIQAAAWATVPGTAPDGVEPWAMLAEAADGGDSTGVRVARALQVRIAANAGLSEDVAAGIKKHADSLEQTKTPEEWSLLDEYARLVTLHESDLLWTDAEGHRTRVLGELPGDSDSALTGPALGADPFADDPFSAPTPDAGTPDAEESE